MDTFTHIVGFVVGSGLGAWLWHQYVNWQWNRALDKLKQSAEETQKWLKTLPDSKSPLKAVKQIQTGAKDASH